MWIETRETLIYYKKGVVTSLAEVWIETLVCQENPVSAKVTSLAEVWIETDEVVQQETPAVSLPLRKCGLKQ